MYPPPFTGHPPFGAYAGPSAYPPQGYPQPYYQPPYGQAPWNAPPPNVAPRPYATRPMTVTGYSPDEVAAFMESRMPGNYQQR